MRTVLMLTMLLTCATSQAERVRGGDQVFQANCARCHGVQADGDSAIAKVVKPRPPDLRRSTLSDAQIREIVTHGGEGVGRSPIMPIWGFQLSDAEIDAVVKYVIGLKGDFAGAKSAARSQ